MPHQCTGCDHLFEDGSQEMLSGCPECGGNKFQFRPVGWTPNQEEPSSASPSEESKQTEGTSTDNIIDASQRGESEAQQSARSDVVSPSDMPNVSAWPGEPVNDDSEIAAGKSDEKADIDDAPEDPYERESWKEEQKSEMDVEALKDELNDQFESIKILSPGEYELNLMELYDRKEYIIALQEDGQYMIEVPNYWDEDE